MIRRKLINFPDCSTDYRLGPGALEELSRMAKGLVGSPNRALVVSAAGLPDDIALPVRRGLIDAGFEVHGYAVPPAGDTPSLAQAMDLLAALEDARITADDALVAVGGQDILSLAQFCARSWCGGTSIGLVPTTLDAMAVCATQMRALTVGDSAEMVQLPARPALVVADLALVTAADAEARKLGYLELMTSVLMDCRKAWDRFGDQLEGLLACEEIPLVDALTQAQAARLSAVKAANPSARSAALYGVTTARALRHLLGPDIPWYRLLAEGMRFEARLGVEAGKLDVDDMFEQDDRLEALGIPELGFNLDVDAFVSALRETRLKRSNRFLFSLPQQVGSIRYATVEDEVLLRHAEAYLASRAELASGGPA